MPENGKDQANKTNVPNINSLKERHPFNGLLHDNVGTLATERLKNVDYNEARDDVVAVSSAGPYANHLHLTPERQKCQHLNTQIFYRPDALPDAQPTVSKN